MTQNERMQKKQKSVFVQNCKKPKNICILCHNLWTNQTLDLLSIPCVATLNFVSQFHQLISNKWFTKFKQRMDQKDCWRKLSINCHPTQRHNIIDINGYCFDRDIFFKIWKKRVQNYSKMGSILFKHCFPSCTQNFCLSDVCLWIRSLHCSWRNGPKSDHSSSSDIALTSFFDKSNSFLLCICQRGHQKNCW